MAIIKHTAVHTTPRAHLKYIMNPHKNEEMKYCTALCCTNDLKSACDDFKEIYEAFSEDKFDKCGKNEKKKHVRIHSYIQSFDNTVTPELAHKIGVQWAKAMFGEDRPVIISTHTNTGHAHNHIAVCPFDVKGNRWLANKKTLALARRISDRICLENGVSIIENPKAKGGLTYAEWLAKKNNTSWKEQMADVIDRLICSPDVTDLESLVEKMKSEGYVFTNEKRMTAKPKNVRYGCSIARLGCGYTADMLTQRILQKQFEIYFTVEDNLRGMQSEIAFAMREFQREIYRSQTLDYHRTTYAELKLNCELLTFISNKNIRSKEEFERYVNQSAELVKYTEDDLTLLKYQNAPSEKISAKEEQLRDYKHRKSEYAKYYTAYLNRLGTDYDRLLEKERVKKEMREYAKEAEKKPERKNPREVSEVFARINWWTHNVDKKARQQALKQEFYKRNSGYER